MPSGATGGDRLAIQYSAARFCEDGTDPIPGITGDTGGTFSSTTGLVFISTSTGQVDLSASTPGSYVVTYTAPSSDTATTSISIDSIPIVSAGADVAICTGNSTVLTATGATTYSWSTGETTASITVDPTTNTTYTVTGFNGACSAIDSVDVTVYPLPTVEITGTLTYCAGLNTTLTATAGLSSYLWSTGATTQSINVTAGSYTVTGTDSNGCSATSSASTVVEYPLPTVSISGTLEFCAGLSTVLTATAGLSSYLWSNGETTQAITVTSGGSYSVTGTDSNGCSNNDSVSVTEHALPTVSISGTLSFCAGANTILTASGASTYLWSTGETTASITVSTGGSYSVTGTDANGCSALDSASVTEYSLPSVSISGTLSYCAGASTTLDAGAGFASYSWSSGETTQTISATAGNYTVTVTDSNGCSNTSAQVTVTETPLDVATVVYDSSSYCQVPTGALAVDGYYPLYTTVSAAEAESSDGTAHSHILGGVTYYMPNDGVVIYHGTYSLTTPAPTITGQSGTFSESTGNLSIDSSTGVINVNNSTAGTYTVVYTTNGSCPNTVNNTITVNALDGATFAYSSNSLPQTGTASLTTTPTTSGGVFSAYPSGLSINSSTGEIDLANSTIQSYKIFYETSGAGCPNSSTFDLAVTAAGIANNYSMNFDSASSDYINIGTSDLVSGVFSISMWIKRETTGQMCLISKDDVSSNRTFNAYFNSSGALNFFMSNTGAFLSNKRTITSNTITDTNWHHLVFINNGDTTNSQIFIDGTEATYSTHNTGISNLHSSSVENKIGTQGSGQYYFNGKIDEVAIWNTALTSTQVSEIYNGTGTNTTKDLSTVAGGPVYWNRMGDN